LWNYCGKAGLEYNKTGCAAISRSATGYLEQVSTVARIKPDSINLGRFNMEKAAFDKLRGHEFNNGLKLRHVASFAIWNKDKPADSSEVERSVGKLKGQYVFVALNFGGTQNLPKDPEKLKELDWKNFHYTFHSNGGDSRIRRVLEGSEFEGAYITDIVKNYATPNAGYVNWIDYVKQHPEHIEWFIEEINLLSADNIKMYLFGKDVENIFGRRCNWV
jgi:hypothetical protein